jgi:CheY-like chemotaxis protein
MDQCQRLTGRRILIVEDEYIFAEDLRAILEAAGATVIGVYGWVADALAAIQQTASPPDAVVLDLNLHGERSYPIADALVARRTHFVFVTGYNAESIAEPYRHFPRCDKPVNSTELIRVLASG